MPQSHQAPPLLPSGCLAAWAAAAAEVAAGPERRQRAPAGAVGRGGLEGGWRRALQAAG